MIKLEHKTLLDAGVHFGHLTRKWNPKMAPFIFMKQNGIHIIDLNQTITSMQEVALQLNAIARTGKKILFVATKKQAKVVVEKVAKDLAMPYVTERWLGGTLTNFVTIRKLLKRMSVIEKNIHSAAYKNLAKKEQLVIAREQKKLNRILQGLANVTRLPSALFVIDVNKEHIAIQEARKLGIPVFALTDTNTDPDLVDYSIPGNDDSFRSIDIIVDYMAHAIKEGLELYKKEKAETLSKQESTEEVKVNGAGMSKTIAKKGVKIVQGVAVKKTFSEASKMNKTTRFKPSVNKSKETTMAPNIASNPAIKQIQATTASDVASNAVVEKTQTTVAERELSNTTTENQQEAPTSNES
ncbi:30S ribosomal protein S2 [Cardinium endosymbiont of Culicoides punctatus]|uniref:30S ribosomal protein S2 n=1 Tax=Cardinium endosymbiont of Culicoides punctatus TaxID=2304601 RepID=UPI0010587535|nr:30S ribosomal protein S2 [Cardinium endosymbiont of Culicoides punctatus]TDG93283.1 30S ribosomal protein S2 [Cardinium endosymbiont of Culicoides punctatus]